jgi:hypothetical protein
MFTLDEYLEIIELAKLHDKTEGDDMTAELEEIAKKYPDKVKFLGETEKDLDLLCGDMRENGYKILNLKEIERRTR